MLVHPEITPPDNFHQLRDTTGAIGGLFVTVGGAQAATLSATDLLQKFNLITTGDVVSKGGFHIDGSALVGGNYYAQNDVVAAHSAGGGNAALIVKGNLSGSLQVNNAGDAMLGSYDTKPSLNGGALKAYDAASVPEDFGRVLSDYSSALASVAPSSGTSVDWSNNRFDASGVASDTAYFSLTESQLATQRDFNFTFGSVDWIVLNIYATDTDRDFALDTAKAQQGLAAMSHVIWNFVGFDTVHLDSLYQGTFLADGATIYSGAGNIEGSVFAEQLISSSELHSNAIGTLPDVAPTAAVPVPAALPLLLGAFGLMAGFRRRKTR